MSLTLTKFLTPWVNHYFQPALTCNGLSCSITKQIRSDLRPKCLLTESRIKWTSRGFQRLLLLSLLFTYNICIRLGSLKYWTCSIGHLLEMCVKYVINFKYLKTVFILHALIRHAKSGIYKVQNFYFVY